MNRTSRPAPARGGFIAALLIAAGTSCTGHSNGVTGQPQARSSASPTRTPPSLRVDPLRSPTPSASLPPTVPPLLVAKHATLSASPPGSGVATVHVSNDDFESTVVVRVGNYVVVTLRPKEGHDWEKPWSAPDGTLAALRYVRSGDGTLDVTFRAEAAGRAGIFSRYDCGAGSCPHWSVRVNVQP